MADRLDIYAPDIEQGVNMKEAAATALWHGRLGITVKSKASGKHITVRATAKRKGAQRWDTVPFAEATHVFIDVPAADGGWPDKVGTYYPVGKWAGSFFTDRNADPARVWCAKLLLAIAAGRAMMEDERMTAQLITYCRVCARELKDPVSIERGIGPECYGASTGSEHQRKGEGAPSEDETPGPQDEAEVRREAQVAREEADLGPDLGGSRMDFSDPARAGATWSLPQEQPEQPPAGTVRLTPGMDPRAALATMERGDGPVGIITAPIEDRLDACRAALAKARRDEESELVASLEEHLAELEEAAQS